MPETSNYDRLIASVNMGRELDLCLALNTAMEGLRACVNSATFERSGKRVNDDLGFQDAAGNSVGQVNPAC